MFSGNANWDQIRQLKNQVKIPVIGSGDLFSAEDCVRMLNETGCDGIMIARGALGNPWIFSQTADLLQGRTPDPVTPSERAEMALYHLQLFSEHSGEDIALREMKKHLGWYIHGVEGAAALRRDANSAGTIDRLRQVIGQLAAAPEGRKSGVQRA
jgi:tRNA-dihydrouridine synthase